MEQLISDMRDIALSALPRMYRPEHHIFAFRLRRMDRSIVQEGLSRRYTAMTLLGLAREDESAARSALCGDRPEDVCLHLVSDVERIDNLGDVAVILWAARTYRLPQAEMALAQLKRLNPLSRRHPTVEVAWSLAALCEPHGEIIEPILSERIAALLLDAFGRESHVFHHGPVGGVAGWLRGHVICFADLVYPTHALAFYAAATGHNAAREAAESCSKMMCRTQGPQGQWWWHFDARTGTVIERYPVYAVHQDAMAPMALFAVADACGTNHDASIASGLQWLSKPPEIDSSLIDRTTGVIWRKVCRREPGKLSRFAQAMASAAHPSWRVPGLNYLFRPVKIDFESRPYHMGWLLYAWSKTRVSKFVAGMRGKEVDSSATRMAHAPPV